MKKFLLVMMAMCLTFAMISCGGDDGPPSSSTKSSDATLDGITIKGAGADINIAYGHLGDPQSTWDALVAEDYNIGDADLTSKESTSAKVTVEKGYPAATVKYAKVTALTPMPAFSANDTFDFEDEDYLAIEVTAENGKKLYYVLAVTLGNNTAIAAIRINNNNVDSMPSWSPTIADANTVQFAIGDPYESKAYSMVVTATDEGAAVKYAVTDKDAAAPVAAAFAAIPSAGVAYTADGDLLYIQVTSFNGKNVAYYKLQINFLLKATINYGTPTINNPPSNLDAKWNTIPAETYEMNRPAPEDTGMNIDTFGTAKVMWDADGLWVYVRVEDPNVSSSPATSNSTAHEVDSVEVFINEDWDGTRTGSYSNVGGQYRIGANGELSGDPAEAITALQALPSTTHAAWKWTEGGKTGYSVIILAPWRFKENFPLADKKKIGFEIQINACNSSTRYGTLVWNNVISQSYQNVTNYTYAELELNDNTLRVEPNAPVITTHPSGKAYATGAAIQALTVAAVAPASGTTQTYQWYSATTSGETGTTISGATSASYTPTVTAANTYYYYVVVTNTLNSGGTPGYDSKSVTSSYATILISNEQIIEMITVKNQSYPVYKFTLPAGESWANYKDVSADIMVNNPAYLTPSYRSRLYGNLPNPGTLTVTMGTAEQNGTRNVGFAAVAGGYMMWNFNQFSNPNSNNPYILDNSKVDKTLSEMYGISAVNEWKTATWDITGGQKLGGGTAALTNYYDENLPSALANDKSLYLGFGLSINATTNVTSFMKNVTLVHKTDTAKNITSTGIEFNGYAANDSGDVTREIILGESNIPAYE
jgi:hypothetical protein